MKNKTCLLTILLISSFLFSFAGCANMSDDAGGGSKTDVFASPRAVINALDTNVKISSNQSARTAVPVNYTLTIDTNNTVTVDSSALTPVPTSTDGNYDGFTGAGFYREQEYTYKILSGEVSTTQCILKMTKGEIADAIGNLRFGQLFTDEVIGTYQIENNVGMKILLKAFQVDYDSSENIAYIFSRVEVYAMQIDANHFQGVYDSVLKCTKNSIDTLDTVLYMTNKNTDEGHKRGNNEHSYVRFDCSSSGKTKKELSVRNPLQDSNMDIIKWWDMKITSSGIKGYAYENKPNEDKIEKKSIYINSNDYSSVYSEYENTSEDNDNNKRLMFFDSEGYFVKWKAIENGWTELHQDNFKYSLKFLRNLNGWKVEKINNPCGSNYVLTKDGTETKYELRQGSGRAYDMMNNYTNYYYFDLEDLNGALTAFPCTLSDSYWLSGVDTYHESFPSSPDSHITAEGTFGATSLKSKLSTWLTDERIPLPSAN
ncbi:hypothetical protein [Treponema sp. C6A8]|uniref:hypothetical protein n=1 Tax=Treponema sp. C6A8 TaxID=1410609 RepID=UPI000482C009|nr:hypothetical protein [Treponema sp. C6A8]